MPNPYGSVGISAGMGGINSARGIPGFGLGRVGMAANDLGLGSLLTDQVTTQTEELRKRKMLEAQNMQSGIATAPGTSAGQLASTALFGGSNAGWR